MEVGVEFHDFNSFQSTLKKFQDETNQLFVVKSQSLDAVNKKLQRLPVNLTESSDTKIEVILFTLPSANVWISWPCTLEMTLFYFGLLALWGPILKNILGKILSLA